MSHYDDGHHTVPGMTTIYLTLETYNKRIGKGWERIFNNGKNFLLLGKRFYIQKLDIDPISIIRKYKLSLISSGPIKYTEKELKKLKEKYDNVILDIQTPTIELNTCPQWVHDWKESFCLNKKRRIWSEARDTIQNDEHPYEVEWSQAYNYWCSDCHDQHTRQKNLLTKFYKTKKSALKASKTIPKSIKYDN